MRKEEEDTRGLEGDRPPGRPRIILVVDDTLAMLNLITAALGGLYEVHQARSASETREQLGKITPDLLILDVRLGDEDGLNLLAEFRQVSTAPVLLITGHGSEAVAIQALHLRANAYMQKPFKLAALRAQVAALLAEGPRPEHLAERAQQLMDRLGEQLDSATEVASRLGVSPRFLLYAFRGRFGRTPSQYLREVRIRRAQHWLLTTDLPIATIAVRTGFRDASYFDRAFKRQVGVSPLVFRRTHVAETPPAPDPPPEPPAGTE